MFCKDMVDGVLVNARTFGNDLTNLTAYAANEASGAGKRFVKRIGRKDSFQILVVNGRPIKVVASRACGDNVREG